MAVTSSQSTMCFPAAVLKSASAMSEVRQVLTGVISRPHLDLVCSVLSELFANAIDHGLLNMDSHIKDAPDGFFAFYQLREQRLKELSEKYWITLSIDHQPEHAQIIMTLEHNGTGLDHAKSRNGLDDDSLTHGRGIMIASKLCDSLEYSKRGRRVTAVYCLDSGHHSPSLDGDERAER